MIIGFGNGVFYKLFSAENDRFSETILGNLAVGPANAVELHCRLEEELDELLKIDLAKLSI